MKFTQPTHQSQVTKVTKPPTHPSTSLTNRTPGECCSNYRIDLKDAAAESQGSGFLVKVRRKGRGFAGQVKGREVSLRFFRWLLWKICGWRFNGCLVIFPLFFHDFCSCFDEQITSKLGKICHDYFLGLYMFSRNVWKAVSCTWFWHPKSSATLGVFTTSPQGNVQTPWLFQEFGGWWVIYDFIHPLGGLLELFALRVFVLMWF